MIAFVIFDNQECQERCLEEFVTSQSVTGSINYNESGKAFTIFGEKLELEEVTEPSDIIWENLAHSSHQIFRKKIIVYCVMLLMLLIILICNILIKQSVENHKGSEFPWLIEVGSDECHYYKQSN